MVKDDCIFCKLAHGEIPSTTIYEDADFRVYFDIAPATKGHCLIIPKEHYADVFEIDPKTAGKLFELATAVAKGLKKVLGCDGMNIMQNNGSVAGQTVFHFHLHLIPRYEGDGIDFHYAHGEADMEALAQIAKEIRANI